MSEPLKICLVMPSGGPEADYYGFEARSDGAVRLYLAISQVGGEPGRDHELSALMETGRIDSIVEAAVRLKAFSPHVVEWACTSGSFIRGRRYAEEQVAALEAAMGVTAGSTSLGFVAAAERLGLKKVSVLATYPPPAAERFRDFLGEFGIEVVSLDCLHAPSGWDAARFTAEFVRERALPALAADAEGLLIPDTALPSLHFAGSLEAELGRPLLTANAVTLWDAQRRAGRVVPLEGHGRLLAGA